MKKRSQSSSSRASEEKKNSKTVKELNIKKKNIKNRELFHFARVSVIVGLIENRKESGVQKIINFRRDNHREQLRNHFRPKSPTMQTEILCIVMNALTNGLLKFLTRFSGNVQAKSSLTVLVVLSDLLHEEFLKLSGHFSHIAGGAKFRSDQSAHPFSRPKIH